MKVRYCQSILKQYRGCDVGWAMVNSGAAFTARTSNCMDEPMEDNCNNIIDTETYRCPTCGKPLEEKSLFKRFLERLSSFSCPPVGR